MLLRVTHHAFLRMADWHEEFRQFVPTKFPLDAENAQRVMNGLHVFIASLEQGRPSTKSTDWTRKMCQKYGNLDYLFVYDWALEDFYQMAFDHYGLVLLTVTAIEKHRAAIVDDPKPKATFEDIHRIEVPYELSPTLDPEDYKTIATPSGRLLELSFTLEFRGKAVSNPGALRRER